MKLNEQVEESSATYITIITQVSLSVFTEFDERLFGAFPLAQERRKVWSPPFFKTISTGAFPCRLSGNVSTERISRIPRQSVRKKFAGDAE